MLQSSAMLKNVAEGLKKNLNRVEKLLGGGESFR